MCNPSYFRSIPTLNLRQSSTGKSTWGKHGRSHARESAEFEDESYLSIGIYTRRRGIGIVIGSHIGADPITYGMPKRGTGSGN